MSAQSRRDFLKILATLPVSLAIQPLSKALTTGSNNSNHVILLVFDAWSAANVDLLGYKRKTMPNLKKFAKKAVVYHNHHSTANFTVPGTSSLLTGTFPWTHRAINLGGRIKKELATNQVFKSLSETHTTVGFAQNVYADQLLDEAGRYLQSHLRFGTYNLNDVVIYDSSIFDKDSYSAFLSLEDEKKHWSPDGGSLFLGPLYRMKNLRDKKTNEFGHSEGYYNGLPESVDENYLLAGLVDGLIKVLNDLKEPSMVYFHVFTPHEPYRPYSKFMNSFKDDGLTFPEKPIHPLVFASFDQEELDHFRVEYDAYIASWDEELGRLFDYFETSGLRKNSHIIITSDHGESHERGLKGHTTSLLYEPLIHVPLIISSPEVNKRINITTPTSSIDILPTITKITGNATPIWAEGELLPGFGGLEKPDRSIYSMDAQYNSAFSKWTKYSCAMIKGDFKITKYNLPDYDKWEFYNLKNDPEEMTDLAGLNSSEFIAMKTELDQKLKEVQIIN